MQRRYRLRHQNDFRRLRNRGRTTKHPLMILSTIPNDLEHNRYGFITPKYLGTAVARNRVRRQMREAVRLLHPHLEQGYDMVIIARSAIMGKPFQEIQRIVIQLCERANLKS